MDVQLKLFMGFKNKYMRQRQNKLNKVLRDAELTEEYQKLANTNSKTTYSEKFNDYLKEKFDFIHKLVTTEHYEYSNYLNKLKWFSYINTKRHEDRFLNKINEKYGKDASFIIGDWSIANRIRGLPTPNMRIKRLLGRTHKVYMIDENNTSKLDHIGFKVMEHPRIDCEYVDKKGVLIKYSRELYSVFTFKMSNENKIYINRDYNATLNMQTIVKSELAGKGRPEEFRRVINENKGDCRSESTQSKPLIATQPYKTGGSISSLDQKAIC